MFIYALSIFLASTAFVDTNAKYGIPLSRYAVFFKNFLLGLQLNKPLSFLREIRLFCLCERRYARGQTSGRHAACEARRTP